MWHDNETTVDYLNFGVVADACANLLRAAGGEPISIGVSGGWGAGKSSLVRMIQQRLSAPNDDDKGTARNSSNQAFPSFEGQAEKNTYVVVTFNPWLYQDFDGARSALLQQVGDELLRQASKDEGLLKKAKRLIARINVLRMAQMGGEVAATIATGIPIGIAGRAAMQVAGFFGFGDGFDNNQGEEIKSKDFDGLLKRAEPISLPSEIHLFREAVEELLDELKITLVVFVDDLDRCLPKTAIATLESIRLLLFLKRSAFVVAADNDFIEGAVRMHFAQSGITKDIATNYFDKLIQVPLLVPRLGLNEVKAYLALLLMQRAYSQGEFEKVLFENALKSIPERLRSSWKGEGITSEFLVSTVGVDNDDMVKLMKLVEGLAPLLSQSRDVQGNPRLMKRFLNTVYLRQSLAIPQDINLDIPALAKWHLVERCDSALANAIASMVTSKLDGRVDLLREAEAAAAANLPLPELFTKEPFAADWLLLEPKLGEEDLRPLLHLSRDTVVRDFGVDELNADGRELRDALIAARSSNQALTETIKKAGVNQAQFAMERAWQLTTGRRTWKARQDMLVLIEPCRVFRDLGAKASALLVQAPVKELGPGVIPPLYSEEWARPILERWLADTNVSQPTRRAINAAKVQSQ